MSILVTGATGFVGTNLVRLQRGHELRHLPRHQHSAGNFSVAYGTTQPPPPSATAGTLLNGPLVASPGSNYLADCWGASLADLLLNSTDGFLLRGQRPWNPLRPLPNSGNLNRSNPGAPSWPITTSPTNHGLAIAAGPIRW